METTILTITFKEGINEEKAMELISEIYNLNSDSIHGMDAKILDSEKTLNEVQKTITEILKDGN